MPVGEYHDEIEVMDYMKELLESNSGKLGINYVAYGEEKLIPEYPAVQIISGETTREIIVTHKFAVAFSIDIWVLHANLNASHRERTREDMILANAVKDLLDTNAKLPSAGAPAGNIIFGFVDSLVPGVLNRVVGAKTSPVVTTRLSWRGESRQTF